MSAIVLGAGGLIGYHVARALALKGLTVYGVVRKESDAHQLALVGVEPLIGTASELKVYESALKDADVVIDAGLADFSVLATGGDPNWISRLVLEATRKASKENSRPKRFIWTSGTALFDTQDGKPINEQTSFTKNPGFGANIKFVQELLALSDVIPTVVAPGQVYGGWFSAWDLLFSFNKATGEVEFPGDPNKRIPSVHVDDLAEGYALVATAPRGHVANEIFIFTSDNQDRLVTVWTALAVAAGSNGKVKYVGPSNQGYLGFLEKFDQVASSQKARRVLGWTPHHASPVDHAKTLFRQFSAWKKERENRK